MLAIEKEEGGELHLLRTIIATAINSVGSGEYRRVIIKRGDSTEDVTCNGEYSCAFSTTAIFHRFGLLSATHTTVDGFEEEVRASPDDWYVIDEPLPGAIGILEGKKHTDGSVKNRHTFICLLEKATVHNGLEKGEWAPRLCGIEDFKHHTGEQRHVEIYFIHRAVLAYHKT